jgi:hypothetical protein
MSSPDLSAYADQQAPVVVSPLPSRATATPTPVIGPGASSPAPRVAIERERSPIPGIAAVATNIAPRIVDAPEPDEVDFEELDIDKEDGALPRTRRVPTQPPVIEQTPPDTRALFDESSWESSEEEGEVREFGPPPPPPPTPSASSPVTSAPPPPGFVPLPPPPPPATRREVSVTRLVQNADPAPVLHDSMPPEELDPIDDAVPTPGSSPRETVLLLVGAEDQFEAKVQRAMSDISGRIVRCTLMTASARARELHPFVIVVPEDVYGFDRFAFNKLAFESESPLLVWEREFGVAQVSALIAIAHWKMEKGF